MSHFDAELETELLTQDFKNMYVQWGNHHPPRTGIHASAILASEKEWCLRELVLLNLYPESAEQGEWNHWDWKKSIIFENGWQLHRRWQNVFRKFGNVVWTPVVDLHTDILGVPESHIKILNNHAYAAELDLTHHDNERNVYFSPDAIILFGGEKYIVEIKGIKEQFYLELTDDVEQACMANETVHKAREQANFYCHLTSIKRGILLIENKNTCDFKVYVIEYEPERAYQYTNRLNDIKGRTVLVQAHGNSKLPLPCCKTIGDARARKCPMRNKCFKAQEESEEW